MTTATGEWQHDFTSDANEAPFVDSSFTNVLNTMRIDSGVLMPSAGVEGRVKLTGVTYTGSSITVLAEVNDAGNNGGDWLQFGALDENNDGIFLEMQGQGNTMYLSFYDNNAYSAVIGTATLTSFAANDLFSVAITKGTPNSVVVQQNGTPITFSTSTYTATLGTLGAVWGGIDGNIGASKIKSIAVVGIDTGGGGGPTYNLKASFMLGGMGA